MNALEEIKERADELERVNTDDLVSKLSEFGEEYKLFARVEADHRRLIAALEAVQQLVEASPRFKHFGGGTSSGIVLADTLSKTIAVALA